MEQKHVFFLALFRAHSFLFAALPEPIPKPEDDPLGVISRILPGMCLLGKYRRRSRRERGPRIQGNLEMTPWWKDCGSVGERKWAGNLGDGGAEGGACGTLKGGPASSVLQR